MGTDVNIRRPSIANVNLLARAFEQKENATKLRFTLKPSPAARLNGFTQTQERPEDIAHMVKAILEIDGRGFTPSCPSSPRIPEIDFAYVAHAFRRASCFCGRPRGGACLS